MANQSLRDFIRHHDERWLFVGIYITLAVVLSIVLSLFWLVAVAGLHFGLELMRQAQFRQDRRDVVTHAMWEIKLDVALVLLALAMALYMNVILGVLGLQSAARAAAATRVVRFTAWERNIRAVILLSDDLARVVQIGVSRLLRKPRPEATPAPAAVAVRRDGRAVEVPLAAEGRAARDRPDPVEAAHPQQEKPAEVPASWRDPWSRGDRFTVALLAASVALVVVAPFLTEHTVLGATQALLAELHPFPTR